MTDKTASCLSLSVTVDCEQTRQPVSDSSAIFYSSTPPPLSTELCYSDYRPLSLLPLHNQGDCLEDSKSSDPVKPTASPKLQNIFSMATLASLSSARLPFGAVDNGRLMHLQNTKNSQNGMSNSELPAMPNQPAIELTLTQLSIIRHRRRSSGLPFRSILMRKITRISIRQASKHPASG